MNKKALIFDLDGTLVNTLSDIAGSVNEMLSHYGFELHSDDEIRRMIGKGARNLITQALPEGRRDKGFVDEALEYYRKCYDINTVVKSYVYEGVAELLEEFKKRGVKMAVLSNKDDGHVKKIVDALLPDYFLFANGFSPIFPHKPSPDSVLAMMKEMGVTKAETAFVGDSAVDVQTAHNAGILSIGVSWGIGGASSFIDCNPDVLVNTPSEILKI